MCSTVLVREQRASDNEFNKDGSCPIPFPEIHDVNRASAVAHYFVPRGTTRTPRRGVTRRMKFSLSFDLASTGVVDHSEAK